MQDHAEADCVDENHVLPQGQREQRFTGRERIHGVQHLNDDKDGQRDGGGIVCAVVGKHVAVDAGAKGGARVEMRKVVEGNLGAVGCEEEVPGVAADSGDTDIGSDDHVTEEEPAAHEGLVSLSGLALHHVVVAGVETEGRGGETIGDEVHPEKLNRDQCFGHAEGSGEEDGDDFANVGGDEVADELLGVVVDGTALFDGSLDGCKVVVCENHVGSEFGNVGTGAHGDTNVGLLESGSVIDTIASHGNNLASGLKEVDKLGLVGRFGTGKQRSPVGSLELLSLGQSIELTAGVGLAGEILVLGKDTDLTADGFSGDLVVTSDDNNTDTCFTALADAVSDFGPGRVQHTNKTKESHVLLELCIFGGGLGRLGERVVDVVNAGQSHDAETAFAVFENFGLNQGGKLFGQGNTPAAAADQNVGAAVQDGFRGALDEQLLHSSIGNQDGHGLPVAGKFVGRQSLDTLFVVLAGVVKTLLGGGVGFAGVVCSISGANLLDQNSQGTFGWLTNVAKASLFGVVCEFGVVAQGGDLDHLGNGGRRGSRALERLSVQGDGAHRFEACPLHIQLFQTGSRFVDVDEGADAHLVGGQSTRLVGADDGAAAQSLDGWQIANDCILGRHLAGAEREASGDDNSETFGNGGDTERNGNLEVVDGALGERTVAGIAKVANVDKPDQDADDGNDLCQRVTKLIELLFEGCRLRNLCGDALVNVANGGVATGQNDDCVCVSSNDGGAGEEHVDLVLLDGITIGDFLYIFADTLRLAGENGLVDAERVAVDGQDAAVGRDTVADRDGNNVAGNQLVSLDALDLAIADDFGFVGAVFLKGRDGLFGGGFLGDTDDGVEDEDGENL